MNIEQQEQNPLIDSLMDYQKVERKLVGELESLKEFSKKLNLSKSVDLIDEVLIRMAERTFSIAIVGEFKRGKSTLINALLGQDILPSDILPCSATLNRITYGVRPSVKIVFKDGQEEEIAIEQLVDYVTKLTEESEKKAESVKEAIVYYPVPYCQNNIDIFDTPGLNDDQNMTEVTLGVLPFVDVAIMVILAQSPFSQFEKDLLENKLLTSDLGRVIFVVNIWDNYTKEQAERLLQNIKKRIQQYVLGRAEADFGKDSEEYQIYRQKIGEPKVFGLYIKQALEAKQERDEEKLLRTGFPEFEKALEKFLTQERGVIFLQVPANRAIASAKEILATLSIQENALTMNKEEFEAAYQKSVAEIAGIRERQKKELKKIDGAAANVKLLIKPIIYELPNQLKRAIEEMIDTINIEPNELDNQKSLEKKMSDNLSNVVRRTTDRLAQTIETEIQKGIDQEVERLRDFARFVEEALTNIEMQFDIRASSQGNYSGTEEAITVALSVFTGFGGIWSGYRVAGFKGAAVGAVASVVTAAVGGIILSTLGLGLFLPVVLVLGIASIFTGGELTKMVFARDRVDNFKRDYKEKVIQEVEKQIREQHLEQKIDEEITSAFELLKQTLRQEVENLLDNQQQTLDDLNSQQGRNLAITETKQQELKQIRAVTERILGNTQGLSNQLVEIKSI